MGIEINTKIWDELKKEKIHKYTYGILVLTVMTFGLMIFKLWGIATVIIGVSAIIQFLAEISYNKSEKGKTKKKEEEDE